MATATDPHTRGDSHEAAPHPLGGGGCGFGLYEQRSAATSGFVYTLICGIAATWVLFRGLCSAAHWSYSLMVVWIYMLHQPGLWMTSVALES